MKKTLSALGIVTIITMITCTNNIVESPEYSGSDQSESQIYQEALAKGNLPLVNEIRLKHMARAMAKALTNPEVGVYLKEKIGQRFDGDLNVLWKVVKNFQVPGHGRLRGVMQGKLGRVVRSMEAIERVPYLQVALPVGFGEWDGRTPIKVAYTPLTIDDTEWEYIYAYDHRGIEYQLDAWTPPDYPLMVISQNERTDLEGNVTFGRAHGRGLGRQLEYDDGGGSGGSGGGSSTPDPGHEYGDKEILYKMQLFDDKEPFSRLSPEIYILVSSHNNNYTARIEFFKEWTGWGSNPGWHELNLFMYYWWQEYGDIFIIHVREEDPGNNETYEFTHTVDNITSTHSWEVRHKDDKLGHQTFNFKDPSDQKYSTGSCEWVLRWESR